MKNLDSARTGGQSSSIFDHVQTGAKKTSVTQSGFALKWKFYDHSMELTAQGTVVALSFVALLGLGLLGVWQYTHVPDPQTATTSQPLR